MAGWFDSYARKSARRAENAHVGRTSAVSRRRFVVGGTAAVATAWTAPMLMSSPAYAGAGASACPAGTFCGLANDGSPVCCPVAGTCQPTGGVGNSAVCENLLGGSCSNSGQGTCSAPYHCNSAENANAINQCNGCFRQNKCGGEGATCGSASDCEDLSPDPLTKASTCSTANRTTTFSYCRRTCATNSDCNVAGGQFCDSSTGLCGRRCTAANASSVCQNPGSCSVNGAVDADTGLPASICQYTANN